MKKRLPHIVVIVLAFFAAAVLFATYGTALPSAPFAAVPLDGPIVADSDGKMTAIVDDESRRMLILNGDGDLTGVVDCSTVDSPVDAISDVRVFDSKVYIAGKRFAPDSDKVEDERVAMYDKGGNLRGSFHRDSSAEQADVSIESLGVTPDGVAAIFETWLDKENAKEPMLFYMLIGEDGLEELVDDAPSIAVAYDIASSLEERKFFMLTYLGVLVDESTDEELSIPGRVFTSIDTDVEGNLYACDDVSGKVCRIEKGSLDVTEIADARGYADVHVNNGVMSLCDRGSNSFELLDAKDGSVIRESTAVTPSIGFSIRMTIVWISGLYLAGLALVLAIRRIRQDIKAGQTGGIGAAFTAVAVVVALAVAVSSVSFASYQASLKVRENEISMCADFLSVNAMRLSETMDEGITRDTLRSDIEGSEAVLNGLASAMNEPLELVGSAQANNIGMYCALYGKDEKGIFYIMDSSSEHVTCSALASGTNEEELEKAFSTEEYQPKMLEGRTLRDSTWYRLVSVPSHEENKVSYVVEIGSKVRSFEASLSGSLAQRILTLLVLILVVYLAYSEVRACGRCFLMHSKVRKENVNDAVAALTRPFTFSITILTGIDGVMTVLIARDLLATAGVGDSSPLLGLPAVMLGVGMVAGQGLYSLCGSRVGLRRLMAIGAFAMLICAAFTAMSVVSGNFWLYCAAKFLMAVPFGLLYTLGYSLPRLARTEETRVAAAGGVKRTDTSAAALGTVLGGYAAQVLGNVWVYVLVAAACIPVILMAINMLPRGMKPLEDVAQPDRGNGRLFDFVKTPGAIGIALFIVLPATVATGYASFLFPLFSADLGLSKADINNIFVLGQLVVYVCISTIDRVEGSYGKWRVATGAMALLGVVFLLFSVNTTLVWSIAVIAIVGVLCKSTDGWKAMWLKSAGELGVPTGRAAGAMFATRSLSLVAQPFILTALLGATSSIAVIVIGAFCVLCAGLFFIVTRRSTLAQAG